MTREARLLAYDQAQGRLQRQVARLAEGRSMTSFLLAATGVVASFFGPRALDSSSIEVTEVLALIALGSGLVCGIRVLRPIRDQEPPFINEAPVSKLTDEERSLVAWRGNVPVDQVLVLCSQAADDGGAHEALARELEARAKVDARLLDRRLRWVQACGVLLATQVVLWTVALF